MPLLSPIFREINFQRIRQLDAGGYQPATIAKIINDESDAKEKVYAPDVRGYLKLQRMGSEVMLISKKGMNSLADDAPGDPSPI